MSPPRLEWDEATVEAMRSDLRSIEAPFHIVLRGHLWAEAAVRHAIEVWVPQPQFLRLDRMAASQLIDLGLALTAVPTRLASPLRTLNRLRNKLAHEVTTDLTEAVDGAALFASFEDGDRDFLSGVIDRTEDVENPLLRHSIAAIVMWLRSHTERYIEQQEQFDRDMRELGFRTDP